MTTSAERTRNLLQAGAFLKELRSDDRLPDDVRNEAHRLLRHYPTLSEVKLTAACEAQHSFSPNLSADVENEWFESYKFGPHLG